MPAHSSLLPERLLARLWRSRAGRSLRTTDGRRLPVVYPDRPAPGHGPDFRDALLELEGMPLRGDVGVHRKARDWLAHGHHRDPAYGSVVLHVVGRRSKTCIAGAVGQLPTVELPFSSKGRGSSSSNPPAPLASLAEADPQKLLGMLRSAGLGRYQAHIRKASVAVARSGVEQTLYSGLLEALGYVENRAPFRALSEMLPVALLHSAAAAYPSEAMGENLGSLLLCAAGWESPSLLWSHPVGLTSVAPGAWRTSGVRPLNHPGRRLEGAVALLVRHLGARAGGLHGRGAVKAGPGRLLEALTVASRPDEEGQDEARSGPALVGAGRARRDDGQRGATGYLGLGAGAWGHCPGVPLLAGIHRGARAAGERPHQRGPASHWHGVTGAESLRTAGLAAPLQAHHPPAGVTR